MGQEELDIRESLAVVKDLGVYRLDIRLLDLGGFLKFMMGFLLRSRQGLLFLIVSWVRLSMRYVDMATTQPLDGSPC